MTGWRRDPGRPTVSVCRGCCCGTVKRAPRVDHAARLAELRRQLAGRATVRVTDCLGPCEQADVVVVVPSAAGRAAGGRPAWLGLVEADAYADLAEWTAAGGPGLAAIPDILELQAFDRP